MSLTIHTAPRPYLPPSDHAITKRVMSMLQDARSFPEQRDALLRVYYPYIRREKPPMFMADPAKHFAQHVIRDGHLSVTMDLDHLRKAVDAAEAQKDKTPYERVGNVLSWLKDYKKEHPEVKWNHTALRRWMQSLLMDFTLGDALQSQKALLPDPNATMQQALQVWNAEGRDIPWWDVWNIGGDPYTAWNDPVEHARPYRDAKYELRTKLHQQLTPTAMVFFHDMYGYARLDRNVSWRDATDYGVLHALLTQDERTFNKDVWLDFIQYRGRQWSRPEYAVVWAEWQDAAFASFTQLNQTRWEMEPRAENSQLGEYFKSPTPIDWGSVFNAWGRHYPLLNQNPNIDAMAERILSAQELAQYRHTSSLSPGLPLLELLGDLPFSMEGVQPLKLAAWMHRVAVNKVLRVPEQEIPLPCEMGVDV